MTSAACPWIYCWKSLRSETFLTILDRRSDSLSNTFDINLTKWKQAKMVYCHAIQTTSLFQQFIAQKLLLFLFPLHPVPLHSWSVCSSDSPMVSRERPIFHQPLQYLKAVKAGATPTPSDCHGSRWFEHKPDWCSITRIRSCHICLILFNYVSIS